MKEIHAHQGNLPWRRSRLTPMRDYRLYVALGDSILSDDYPGPGYGAAALLAKKLALPTENRTRTGYTVPDVLQSLETLKPHLGPVLVILTVGGNDLLINGATTLATGLQSIAQRVKTLFPDHELLLGNLYDPTEGTGLVQSDEWRGTPARPELIKALQHVNGVIQNGPGRLVDLYTLFQGHAKDWIMRDIEPNRDGARAIADAFFQAIP